MQRLCAAIFAALFVLQSSLAAFAQDVVLRSRDGAIELSGNLLGYDGEFYRLQTEYGELTVDGSGVLCNGVGCPSLTDYVAKVTISGSATIGAVLMPALVEAFARRSRLTATREDEGAGRFFYVLSDRDTDKVVGRFAFRIGNTASGFEDLLTGEADIAMALREMRNAEHEAAQKAGLGDLRLPNRSRVLALDALVPVVSAKNPVEGLSLPDLSAILSGDLTNWQRLGGPDAPVVVHLRDAASGLAQRVSDRMLRPVNGRLGAELRRHSTNSALSKAVATDMFALGLASFSEVGNAKPLVLTGACGFQLRADRRTIKTEDYPLTAPMFLYLPARRLPALVRDFLAFTRSSTAQIVIRRAGFVDQAPEEVAIDLQGNRFSNAISVAKGLDGLAALQRMTRTLSSMRRLTTSFRFEAGSSRLDAQSRSNVQQLARALEAGTYDGRRVVFVGFSDGVGPVAGNLAIAKERAEAVREAVLSTAETAALERLDISTEAFGEAMPMACDDSSWGREVNRRVEVWVR